MKKQFLLYSLILLTLPSFAQVFSKPTIKDKPFIENAGKNSEIISVEKLNIPTVPSQSDISFLPALSSVNPSPKIEGNISGNFRQYHDTSNLVYITESTTIEALTPVPFKIRYGSDVNEKDNNAPLDNSIAYSEANYIVSVSNGFIEYWNNGKRNYKRDLESFIKGAIKSPCDPKVYYDPVSKRFILFMQKCGEQIHLNSQIMIGFSISANPLDGWNFYKLSGNPTDVLNGWFDYPKIGISTDGLFISGNIFTGPSSAAEFNQTVVYQIDKSLGYSGQQLKYKVWYDIADMPTTLMPVSYAYNNTYEKGIYLLGTTYQNGIDYIKLYDVTGNIYDLHTKLNFYKVRTEKYRFFAKAIQVNRPIDNGDIRIQDAVLAGNNIYYVFTSGDERNFSRINFNVLSFPSLSNKSTLIGDNLNSSYAYPSLSILTNESKPATIIIQYNSSSDKSYPDIRCKACDENLMCSKEIQLKQGESTITNSDRWGDYSGVAKDHTYRNSLWLVSSYGKGQNRQSYMTNIVSINQPASPEDSLLVRELVNSPTSINFNLLADSDIKVLLKSAGKTSIIFQGKGKKGENKFEMITDSLPKGDYYIQIIKQINGKLLKSKKIETE